MYQNYLVKNFNRSNSNNINKSLDGLNYNLNKEDSILKIILILEALLQLIEAIIFYVWVIYALKDLKIMTLSSIY